MSRRTGIALVAVGSAAALLTACGTTPTTTGAASSASSSASASASATTVANDSAAAPKKELTDAIAALSQGSSLAATLSLSTSAADLTRIASLDPGDSGLTRAQANAIAAGHITIEEIAPAGKTLAQVSGSGGAKGSAEITMGSGSSTYFSLLSVNGSLYVRVDIKSLVDLAGESGQYTKLTRQVATFPPFVKALIADKWVIMSAATIQSLEGFAKGAEGSKVPTTTQTRSAQAALMAAVLKDLAVTRTSKGTTDQLTITGNIRPILRDSYAALATALPEARRSLSQSLKGVPSQAFTIDSFVTGGKLAKLSFDAGQFDKTDKISLPIQAVFVEAAPPITAPTGATPLDLSQLGSLVGAARGFGTSPKT